MSKTHEVIPAIELERGCIIDDERFPHVMVVGHLTIGRKWVTARSFHPESHVSPNPAYRIAIGDTVQVGK